MNRLSRPEAKLLLAELLVAQMDFEGKQAARSAWWNIDEDDEEWTLLPQELRDEMASCEEPTGSPEAPRYEPLLILAELHNLTGVRNEWLAARLSGHGLHEVSVFGTTEQLQECPCCSFLTLDERGQYYICPVCYWEDDGSNDPSRYSGPNHKSLADGRSLYARTGSSDAHVRSQCPDIQAKFESESTGGRNRSHPGGRNRSHPHD